MAFDFPSSNLTVGQIVTGPNNTIYKWDGVKWEGVAAAAVGGVTSFNSRTGAVTLVGSDITGAGGALESDLGNYLPLVGGTLTGPVLMQPPTGVPQITFNAAAAGTFRTIAFQTAGSARWDIDVNADVEDGSDDGSNFVIRSYHDNGTLYGTPLTITRNSNFANFSATVNVATNLNVGNTITSNAGTLVLNKAGFGQVLAFTSSNHFRWQLITQNPESGSNTGSDFAIQAFSDGSALLSNALTIVRATGVATFSAIPTAPTASPGDSSTNLATTAFVAASVSGGASFLPTAGGTLTGPLTVTPTTAGQATIALNDAAGHTRQLNFETAGSMRWQINAGSVAESGSNAGSNLNVLSYADNGSLLGTPLSINRATSAFTLAGGIDVTGMLPSSGDANHANFGMALDPQVTGSGAWIALNANQSSNGIAGSNYGNRRWSVVLGDGSTESGSDAGSNFQIVNCHDSGANIGAAFSIQRSNGAANFAGNVSGGSYTTNGTNAGVYYDPRNGSGNQFCIYNIDGSSLHFWDSGGGDMGTWSNGQFILNQGMVVATAPQIKMTPNVGAGGYGSMWHNDGSSTYLLLTNQNDALGGWNGLRPFTVNDSNGSVSMNQGVSISGGLSSDNITDRGWGIIYSNYAGNYVGFQWTGTLQIVIDGNGQGTIITSNNWGNYIPNASNNPAGCVLRSGDTMTGNLTVNASTQMSSGCHVGGNGIQYYSLANNVMGLKWVGNATQIIVDGSYQGTINTSSDGGRKANLGGIEVDPLADVLQIKLQSYDQTFIEGEQSYHYPIGMIAQNLLNIGPDMVDVATEHDPETGEPTDETSLGVILLPLLSRLVGSIQQLSARVEALELAMAPS